MNKGCGCDKNEYCPVCGFDEAERMAEQLRIAKEALYKLANDTSPPWDNLDWKRIAIEAMKKIDQDN
jgi:hypothetical protein